MAGVIDETQEADSPFLMSKHRAVQFEFNIFCPGSPHVRIEVNAVGYFRHQGFRKSYCPAPLVIFEHRRKRESSRVRRIVVRAVVIHRPVHELKSGVAAVSIGIEEVRQTELAEADFEPAIGKRPPTMSSTSSAPTSNRVEESRLSNAFSISSLHQDRGGGNQRTGRSALSEKSINSRPVCHVRERARSSRASRPGRGRL